jgi:hypothetical protein
MAYTEIKKRNGRAYYYRVLSVRKGKKVSKKREYLGIDLSKEELSKRGEEADVKLVIKKSENKIIAGIKPKIVEVLKRNNVSRAGIFGSYALGEQRSNSDIDIVIEPQKGTGLGFVKIQFELQDKLGRKVDLVTYKSLHPLIKKRILNEEIRII